MIAPPVRTVRRNRLSPTGRRWLLVAILLLSFGLRVYRLGNESVWWDEGWATWHARQPLAGILERTASDTHPPLYLLLLHYWRLDSGDGEFGLRFLSAAIGLLTVAATYLLGRKVGGVGAGSLAALFVGISRFDIWWSQEMRMYALAALLATLSLWAAIRLWDRGRLVDWVLYVVFTLAGLHTLYLFVSVLVVANLVWLWVLLRAERRYPVLLRWVSAQVLVLLLYLPWLAFALGRIPTWSAASPVTLGVFLKIYWTVLTIGIPVSVERYLWLTLPVLAIFLAGLVTLFWQERRNWQVARNGGLLLLGLLLPAGVVYLLSLPREAFFYSPQLAPRYLLVFAPSFYVLLAWGLTRLGEGRRWLSLVALAALVVAVAVFGLWSYYPARILRDDYKALAATLRAYQRSGDAVVLHNDQDWPVFAYHYPGQWQGIPNGQRMTPGAAEHYLTPTWETHQGVWLVVVPYAGINDPQGNIAAWLEARAARVVEHRFADKVLRFYARTEGRADTAHELAPSTRPPSPLAAQVESGLKLVGYEQTVREYQAGDVIHLFLYWEAQGLGAEGSDELEVALVDREGTAWKRATVPRPALSGAGEIARQQVDLVVPPDAPGGGYAFVVRFPSGVETSSFGKVLLRGGQRASLTAADVSIAYPLETNFEDGVRLLGYDVGSTTLQPGDAVDLTLYWQAREPVEHRYKVFTHLLGQEFNPASGNPLWGQQDNEPVGGTRPTSTWRPGEVIVDGYVILLDVGAPPGSYAIEIGLYDPATGERLSVLDASGQAVADRLILTQVTVGGGQ